MEMKNMEALQAKEKYFKLRKEFLTYLANRGHNNIDLARKDYLEWKDTFCKESSDETLIAFLELMKKEKKGSNDAGSIEFDAIMPVQDELYNRAIANMNPANTKRVTELAKEGMKLTKYYDEYDLKRRTTPELPKADCGPLDKYVNKVLKTCTLEECLALLSLMKEKISEYVKSTFVNPNYYTRGYGIEVDLTMRIQERVIEETYSSEPKKEEESKKAKSLGSIFSQRKW